MTLRRPSLNNRMPSQCQSVVPSGLRLAACFQVQGTQRKGINSPKAGRSIRRPGLGQNCWQGGESSWSDHCARAPSSATQEQLEEFSLVPEFESRQAHADDLEKRIRQLRTDDTADRRNLKEIESDN